MDRLDPGSFLLTMPLSVIVNEQAMRAHGFPGAIVQPKHPLTGEAVLPFFTDTDLAQRAIDGSRIPDTFVLTITSTFVVRALALDFLSKGGAHVALDPIARANWNTVTVEDFLDTIAESP